jgi:hypothetical protein
MNSLLVKLAVSFIITLHMLRRKFYADQIFNIEDETLRLDLRATNSSGTGHRPVFYYTNL